PSAAIVTAMKAEIEHSRGHTKEAEAGYRQALQSDPTIDLAANNLAYMLAQEGRDLNTALELAQGVRRRQPDNPGVADTLAWVYYKLDRLVLARDQAQFAASKSPGKGIYQYHLGEIYKKNSQKAEAIATLKKAVSGPKDYKERDL